MAAKEKRGLGIGLDALFGPDLQTEPDEIRTLPLSQVEPRQDQPRESFDEERLQDLAASISRHGLIQPVIVRRLEDGYYQIIAGERRWRAARMADPGGRRSRCRQIPLRRGQRPASAEPLQAGGRAG